MSQHDRRLVLIVQGDDVTTMYHYWLETPCSEHGSHVVTNQLADVPAKHIEHPHGWMETVLQEAADQLCLCGAQTAAQSALTAVLEATRA